MKSSTLSMPMALDVAAHARGVVRHRVDHLAVGLREEEVVLEEVDVPVDVRHHQLLVDQRVALEQVGVGGVVVDHHLVDLREAVLVALGRAARTPCRSASAGSGSGSRRTPRSRSSVCSRGSRRSIGEEVEAVVRARSPRSPRWMSRRYAGKRLHRHGYLPLPEEVLDRVHDRVLVLDLARSRTRSSSSKCSLQVLDELARAVGALDLAVAEQVHARAGCRSSGARRT